MWQTAMLSKTLADWEYVNLEEPSVHDFVYPKFKLQSILIVVPGASR
jgi:hypothetical protein